MAKIEFKIVEFKSIEYQQALGLRNKILREPLGLRLTAQDLKDDPDSTHIVACFGERVVASLILTPKDAQTAIMRQVAIVKSCQSKSMGSQLVCYSEQVLLKHGFKTVELAARQSALDFYEKLGYWIFGPQFLKLEITHFPMIKILSPL